MSTGPRTPLPAHHLAVREEIMNGNGINYIFPLGRDYGYTYPANFEPYDGSAYSVFGYIVDMNNSSELGIKTSTGGLLLMKTENNSKATVVYKYGHADSLHTAAGLGQNYYNGQPFMFRVRVDTKGLTGYQNGSYGWDQHMDVKSVHISEYFKYDGSDVLLSVHYGDYPPSVFPLDKGLGLIIPGLIVMNIGTYAVYEGIYSGSDPINIMATGAVRDLGKPSTSGVNVRIGIRKNLTMYVFVADYGSAPVAAPFAELVKAGHAYIPRFTPNFNIRRILIESYF